MFFVNNFKVNIAFFSVVHKFPDRYVCTEWNMSSVDYVCNNKVDINFVQLEETRLEPFYVGAQPLPPSTTDPTPPHPLFRDF